MDLMTFFLTDWLGKPAWMWLAFMGVVLALLVLDLGVLHRDQHEIGVRESLLLSSMYIAIALAFGGWVWWELGSRPGMEYLTGFAIEKSLAMDNVFVIAMIFGYFAIPRALQHRVLFWGILGVIVLRALMIGAGAALVSQYGWVLYIFAAFLIFTGIKMFFAGDGHADVGANPLVKWMRGHMRITAQLHGQKFFVRERHPKSGKMALWATPMFLALVMIEIADVIFAVDSVPAIFAITTDPYIVYTSNIFAILGLRALYFALAAIIHRFAYLKQALAVLLVFIGGKIFVADLLGWEKFPAEWSLAITGLILAAGVFWSLCKTRGRPSGISPSRSAGARLQRRARILSPRRPANLPRRPGCARRPARTSPGGPCLDICIRVADCLLAFAGARTCQGSRMKSGALREREGTLTKSSGPRGADSPRPTGPQRLIRFVSYAICSSRHTRTAVLTRPSAAHVSRPAWIASRRWRPLRNRCFGACDD